MKYLATAGLLLTLTVSGAGACSVVEVVASAPSSENVRITVLLDGRPQRDVPLQVAMSAGQPPLLVNTDSNGVANLLHLSAGLHCVTALGAGDLTATLCLAVKKERKPRTSVFSMILAPGPQEPPTFEESLAASEKMPIEVHAKAFAGSVQDPIGTASSKAKIAIYRHGDGANTRAIRMTATDGTGRFSVPLSPGVYTMVIESPGFKTRFTVFEIEPDASQEDILVKLQLGACT